MKTVRELEEHSIYVIDGEGHIGRFFTSLDEIRAYVAQSETEKVLQGMTEFWSQDEDGSYRKVRTIRYQVSGSHGTSNNKYESIIMESGVSEKDYFRRKLAGTL